jgi:hypothetical protein
MLICPGVGVDFGTQISVGALRFLSTDAGLEIGWSRPRRGEARMHVREEGKVTATLLVGLLALGLSACSRDASGDRVGTGSGDRTTPASNGTHPALSTAGCAAGVQFRASNSGVAAPGLAALARRLGTTSPDVPEPTPGQVVFLESDVPGAGHVSYRVTWSGTSWRLMVVQVCAGAKYAKTCGRAVQYAGHRYRLEPAVPGVGNGVAQPLGAGWALGCSTVRVGPIGVYGASEEPASEAVTVSRIDGVRKYLS